MNNQKQKIILASGSPRRAELLNRIGLEFQIVNSKFKEDKLDKFSNENIKKNSLGKALDVAKSLDYSAIVIGADTTVILGNVCLNKPRNFKEAFFMLKNLSNKSHQVVTAISLVESITLKSMSKTVVSEVFFRDLSDIEIEEYIKTGSPMDKAGAYGIQDFVDENTSKNPPEGSFISKIEGDYCNIMGISTDALLDMLSSF